MDQQEKEQLGLKELVAIGIAGMVGGGIFSALGLSDWLDMPPLLPSLWMMIIFLGTAALELLFNQRRLLFTPSRSG